MKHLREAVTRSKTAPNISADSDNDLMALKCLQLEGCREKQQKKAPLLLGPSAFSDPSNPSEQDDEIQKKSSSPILGYLIRHDDGNVFTVTDVCLVGRGHQCHVKLSGNNISRHHARILVAGVGQVVIQPLSQAKHKKVRVNSDEISEEHVLEDGDTLQVGNEIFKWKMKVMKDKDPGCGQVFSRRKVPFPPSSLQVHVND